MRYTTPVLTELKSGYVHVYFRLNGVPHKIRNGKKLGVWIFPNNEDAREDRIRLGNELLLLVKKALRQNWNFIEEPASVKSPHDKKLTTREAVELAIKESRDQSTISLQKMVQLDKWGMHLIRFLEHEGLAEQRVDKITADVCKSFLQQYEHFSPGYQNKIRRSVSELLEFLKQKNHLKSNPMLTIKARKVPVTEYAIFSDPQLVRLIADLQKSQPDLYMCSLFMFYCFLSPTKEIRHLRRKHFNEDLTHVFIGTDISTGGLRKIFVPDDLRQVLITRGVMDYSAERSVFTGAKKSLNRTYFNNLWNEFRMLHASYLSADHELKTFFHTAAVKLWNECHNIELLRKAMNLASKEAVHRYVSKLPL